ncbi:nuclear transport factor 2 family protein [Bifidobacterium aquikefiricola]|uniref:Nuclear transport factor 2 family protein n=1 Tax=Bifidobacterium aquikefiricola TaxID=3059038 RepID=A0AB39U7P1_9BIFI
MNTPTDTLNRYFSLSNTAGQNGQDFTELIKLFASEATITSGRGETAKGIDGIQDFFRTFFARNTELHHVWNTRRVDSTQYAVDWAVAGRSAAGKVFAITGTDTATLNADNRITSLLVEVH